MISAGKQLPRLGMPFLLMGSLLCLASLLEARGQAPADESAEPLRIEASMDPVYDPLFAPHPRGFLGADGALSVPLTREKTLWVFADTFLGTLHPEQGRRAMMVHNSLAIHDSEPGGRGKATHYWDFSDRVVGSFFMAEGYDQHHWYWPGTGANVDGEVFLFLVKVLPKQGDGAFAFATDETVMFHIRNPLDSPDQWQYTKTGLGIGNRHRGFATGVYVEKPYFYLMGFDDPQGDAGPSRRRMVLAWAKIDDLRAGQGRRAMEFWTEREGLRQWSNEPTNLAPLFSPGCAESSIQYDKKHGRFIVLTQYAIDPTIYVVTAPNLTGPWSEPARAFSIEDVSRNERYFTYAFRSHPELAASENELVVTYVVNSGDFWGALADPTIYYPRFVRMKLDWAGYKETTGTNGR